MKRLILLSLSCFALAASALANIMIDDFSDGARTIVLQSGSEIHVDPATVIGGTRAIFASVLSNPLNQDFEVNIASPAGFAIVNSGTLVEGQVELGYGYDANLNDDDMNVDFSGEDRFRLSFLSNDLPLDLFVWLRSSSSDSGNYVFLGYQVAANLNPFDFDVMFSDFTTTDFTDIDQIVFQFFPSPSGDFALTQIEAVPEPATMLALGAGLAALAARRRRKA